MPAERLAGPQRGLDVDAAAGSETARASVRRSVSGHGVEVERAVRDGDRRQADAVERDRVADVGSGRRLGRAHAEADGRLRRSSTASTRAELADDAR